MKLRCILGHNYKPIQVHHYRDNSWFELGALSTTVTKVCKHCCKIKVTNHYGSGYLKLEDLNEVQYFP
jgi:hypothetical protein